MRSKSGVADIIVLAGMAIIGLIAICGRNGFMTRSIRTNIDVRAQGTNIVTLIYIDGQRVEVSGSGGVSIPMKKGMTNEVVVR